MSIKLFCILYTSCILIDVTSQGVVNNWRKLVLFSPCSLTPRRDPETTRCRRAPWTAAGPARPLRRTPVSFFRKFPPPLCPGSDETQSPWPSKHRAIENQIPNASDFSGVFHSKVTINRTFQGTSEPCLQMHYHLQKPFVVLCSYLQSILRRMLHFPN